MERFACEGMHPTYDPHDDGGERLSMVAVSCARCGHEADDVIAPRACPTCGGSSFERVPRPGMILAFQNRGGRAVRYRRHGPPKAKKSERVPRPARRAADW